MENKLLTIFNTYGKSHQVSKLLEEVGEFIETVMNEDKENIACNWKDSCLENAGKIEKLETQQKKFIEWLEAMNRMYQNEYKDIDTAEHYNCVLQKYKSIIGDDK